VLSIKWKGNVCTTSCGSAVSPCPTQGKIMNSFSQHSTSSGHKQWNGTTSPSFQSWTATTPSVINKRQSPFWFSCTVNCSPPPHVSVAPNSCQPFTPWTEAFFPATSVVNSIFQSNNTWCWSEKHDLASNFNVAELSLQRSVCEATSGESKKECCSFRSSTIFAY